MTADIIIKIANTEEIPTLLNHFPYRESAVISGGTITLHGVEIPPFDANTPVSNATIAEPQPPQLKVGKWYTLKDINGNYMFFCFTGYSGSDEIEGYGFGGDGYYHEYATWGNKENISFEEDDAIDVFDLLLKEGEKRNLLHKGESAHYDWDKNTLLRSKENGRKTIFDNGKWAEPVKEKSIEFTHIFNLEEGWEKTELTPSIFKNVNHLGKCAFDGDMFSAVSDNKFIQIFKGHLNNGKVE